MTLQKTDAFVPLTPVTPTDKNREFRVTVVANAEPVQAFTTLGQNPVGKGQANSTHTGKNCEPRLSLEHDGERISNIRIQCSCGQVMDLACVYDESIKPK